MTIRNSHYALQSLILAGSCALALSARPGILEKARIDFRVLVPGGAMGDFRAHNVSGPNSSDIPLSTPEILLKRDGLQVRGVYATSVFAPVVDLHSVRDGADMDFIRKSMGAEHLPVSSSAANLPVSIRQITDPVPAFIRGTLADVHPESLIQWYGWSSHAPSLTVHWLGSLDVASIVAARHLHFTSGGAS